MRWSVFMFVRTILQFGWKASKFGLGLSAMSSMGCGTRRRSFALEIYIVQKICITDSHKIRKSA
eukprot:4860495-Amphidinium_carterae.1